MIVEMTGATTTGIGLNMHAKLGQAEYPKGIKVTDAEMEQLKRNAS